MANRRPPDTRAVRDAVEVAAAWLKDETAGIPERAALAEAVRLSARLLAAIAPGSSVEVRIPPFVAVQCISGPPHTRGTPPNVVEADVRGWLLLAAGMVDLTTAVALGNVQISGSRAAEIGQHFPLVDLR